MYILLDTIHPYTWALLGCKGTNFSPKHLTIYSRKKYLLNIFNIK